MATPDEIHRAKMELGISLAAAREAAGLTQKQLGKATIYGRSSIANVETARQNVPRTFWVACDELLGTSGDLTEAYDRLEALIDERRRDSAHVSAQTKLMGLASLGASPWTADDQPAEHAAISLTPGRRPVWLPRPQPGRNALGQADVGGSGMPTRPDHLMLTVDERARELYIRGHGMLHGNQRQEIEVAQVLLDRAVGRDPRLAFAIADRGYTRWRKYFAGWTDSPAAALTGALRDVEAALAMDPDSVAAHTTFIRACWDMGWHQRALTAGRSVYLRHPDSLDATIAYSRALMNAGMAELALPLAASVLREDPTHPAATKLTIWCQLLLGRHEHAIDAAKPYLAAQQGDANTRWAVALASANVKSEIEYALRIAQEAVQADESDVTVWLLLGYLHRRHGDESAAREAWKQGISQVEGNSLGVNHRTAAWAANVYAALGDRTAALESVAYLVENEGNNGYIRYRLFHALAELGDTAAAAAMLDSAVTCGFLSVQLMRQEEMLAPHRMRTSDPYRRVNRRLDDVVKSVRDGHMTKWQYQQRCKESNQL